MISFIRSSINFISEPSGFLLDEAISLSNETFSEAYLLFYKKTRQTSKKLIRLI